MTETFYDVLGVNPDADVDDIEAAYRKQVHEWHPDVSDHPDARERFLTIKRAKEVLTDTKERDRYDRMGHASYVDGADNGATDSGPDTGGGRDRGSDSGGADGTTGGTGRTGSDRRGADRTGRQTGGTDGQESAGSSAAAEYKRRQQRSRTRTRGEHARRSGGDDSGSDDTRRRRTERQTGTGDDDANESDRSDDERSETTDESGSNTTSRSVWQPSDGGWPFSGDSRWLLYPGLLVYYVIADAVGFALVFALALVPAYVVHRRWTYTDRILSEGSVRGGFGQMRQRLTISMFTSLVSLVFMMGMYRRGIEGGLFGLSGLVFMVGIVATAYYFKELLLRDWFDADGTKSPIAWDVSSRLPLLLVPLVSGQLPEMVVSLFILCPALIPIAYFLKTGQHRKVAFLR